MFSFLVVLLIQLLYYSSGALAYSENNDLVSLTNSTDATSSVGERFRYRDAILNYYRSKSQTWENLTSQNFHERIKRYDPTTFRGHPKTREERWHVNFKLNTVDIERAQAQSLVSLLNKILEKYMNACIPMILYDDYVEDFESVMIQLFFQTMKGSYLHGKIDDNYNVHNEEMLHSNDKRCRSYILFLSDVLRARDVLGPQTSNRVILIPRSTQWKLQEFLSSKYSSDIINLLVIGESLSTDSNKERPYVLYTHQLYTDGLGSNMPIVLTSWIKGQLSRPHVDLFPPKFRRGFAGHRFTVTAIHQPPYVIKKLSTDGVGNTQIEWDGFEFRILKMLSTRLNFTYEIIEPRLGNELGPTYGVIDLVADRRADMGLAGAFVSVERLQQVEMSHQHSMDCAAFITLASKALPRYRAIMGPFQWPVWLAIIITYLFAIFPLAFSDRLTLSHLIGNWGEIENMFWYVFGTFTNSLTFTGEFSWSNSNKSSTRLLIGTYWVFSIIITACYTSSIIAFVTLPVFPDTIDSISDLVSGFYRIGTFAKDGWQYWFTNSSHPQTKRLLKSLELVDNIEEGLGNVTSAFFWGYAFLGSRAQLEFIVQTNFTDKVANKRSALHIADECLSIFGISYVFPLNSVYTKRINDALLRIGSSGLFQKTLNEMAWDLQRSDTGKLLQAAKAKKFSFSEVEERKLNLADTEGMFLLMGVGYLTAGGVLFSEIVGGCARKCRQFVRRNSKTIADLKSSLHPHIINRPSDGTPTAGHTVSEQQQFNKSIFRRFRRNSDQAKSLPTDIVKKHKRTDSMIGNVLVNSPEVLSASLSEYGDEEIENDEVMEIEFHANPPSPAYSIQDAHSVEINRPPTPYTKIISDEALEEFGEVVRY